MKRYVVAVASLFGLLLALGAASADYFVIKIDLNNLEALTNPPLPPQTNPKGGPGGGINPKGGPGGGINPKGGPGGGINPKGGFGGQPGGFGGQPGGFGGQPGGFGGQPGGFGGQPGGFGGAQNGGGGAQLGGFGGAQPGGNKGGPGMGMMGGPGGGKDQKKEEIEHRWVHIYLEAKSKVTRKDPYIEFDHQFGKKAVIPMWAIGNFYKKESVAKEFEVNMKKYAKDPGKILELANFALTHGGMKEFHQAMDEVKSLNSPDPSHQAILKQYESAKEIVKRPLTDEDTNLTTLVQELKAEGYRSSVSDQGHYLVLSNMPKESEGSLKRRLDRLEETFATYFYWLALQDGGPKPQAPKKRLVAVVVNDKSSFEAKHVSWGSQPMAADGFTPRRDNLVILSARRLDDTFALFEKNTQPLVKGIPRDELVSGKVWDVPQGKYNSGTVAIKQTLALVHRGLEDEAERAAITHEGARQLLAATGLLPRTVEVPEWIQFGMGSNFETPLGAVYTSFATPSWAHLVSFRHLDRNKKFGDPAEVLFNLINDRYFRQAARITSQLPDAKDKDKLLDQQKNELEKGRAASWSFVFFLAQDKKMHFVQRYCDELNNLPRDLELDERTLQGCFARAFEMTDPRDPNRIDRTRLRTLANQWFEAIAKYNLEIPQVETEMIAIRNQPLPKPPTTTDPGKTPGLPNPGGGFPNPGGGFPNPGGGFPNPGGGVNPGGGFPNPGGGFPNPGGGGVNPGGGFPNPGGPPKGGFPNPGGQQPPGGIVPPNQNNQQPGGFVPPNNQQPGVLPAPGGQPGRQ